MQGTIWMQPDAPWSKACKLDDLGHEAAPQDGLRWLAGPALLPDASLNEAWPWALEAQGHRFRRLALGSLVAMAASPPQASGLAVGWWGNGHQAEATLLEGQSGHWRELLHQESHPNPGQFDWFAFLAAAGRSRTEVAWVGQSWAAGSLKHPMPPVFPHARTRTVAPKALPAVLDAWPSKPLPILGCHHWWEHPRLQHHALRGSQCRPVLLPLPWQQESLPLVPLVLVGQSPGQGAVHRQSWWWVSLRPDANPHKVWGLRFAEDGKPAQAVASQGQTGEALIRWHEEGGHWESQMREALDQLEAQPIRQRRLAHLAAHALWPYIQQGPKAWPRVEEAWAQLLAEWVEAPL